MQIIKYSIRQVICMQRVKWHSLYHTLSAYMMLFIVTSVISVSFSEELTVTVWAGFELLISWVEIGTWDETVHTTHTTIMQIEKKVM